MQGPRQKVLTVDDEPRNLRILEEVLADFTELRSAPHGEGALALVREFVPDLILLDIMMPGRDGYAICRELRALPQLRLTRIVLVSGKALTDERLAGYDAGADDYVTKPFIPEELAAKARVYLRLVEAERQLLELNQGLEAKVQIRTEQLIRSERAAFVGLHTAEIVHNLKNPLAILSGNLELLREAFPDNRLVRSAEGALERMQDTIKSILLNGAQDAWGHSKPYDINQVLRNELRLLEVKEFFRYRIQLHLELGELPPVHGRVGHFSQSFGNLIKNAAEAMYNAPRKELTVRTSCADERVRIEIVDTGSGISPENLSKVFDPFFTTKPSETTDGSPTGTGLGLASARKMIEAYGGTLELESRVGEGTRASVTLPLHSGLALADSATPEMCRLDSYRHVPASMPPNEGARLEGVRAYSVPPDDSNAILEDLVALASTIARTNAAAVSFVRERDVALAATHRLGPFTGGARGDSFCAHVIHQSTPFIVEDALSDARFADNPYVRQSPGLRFYAGFPLITPDGCALGTVCVIDPQPQRLKSEQVQGLQAITDLVMAYLECRRHGWAAPEGPAADSFAKSREALRQGPRELLAFLKEDAVARAVVDRLERAIQNWTRAGVATAA